MMGAHRHPHGHSLERCRALVARLNDYLDGELPPDLCAELDAHQEAFKRQSPLAGPLAVLGAMGPPAQPARRAGP